MLVAGLTGGMACGKSFVGQAFGDLGCHVIEADEVARELMQPGGEVTEAVIAAFGPRIQQPGGGIDRAALASLVFNDPRELERLNALVHPAVRRRSLERIAEIGASEPRAIVVYVAAILVESGGSREVDKLIVVSCGKEHQLERAMLRPGATEASVAARLDRQLPLETKRRYADYLIDTSGTKADTLRQTKIVYEDLKRLAL